VSADSPLFLVLDLTGTFAFALNGALTAIRVARLDVVGVVTLGMITALGGGIIRDILLGSLPPATFSDWRYLAVAATGSLIAFGFGRRLDQLAGSILVLDAAGLSLFAVSGASLALDSGVGFGQASFPQDVPVVEMSAEAGAALVEYIETEAAAGRQVTMTVTTSTVSEVRESENVIAETTTGRTDRVVVSGAHLDSVAEGPGINDNGSGSAAQLEVALQMAELGIEPRNQVRFVWFGAEEAGLVGSAYYVDQLTKAELKDIAVMLNFDMVGSPNPGWFVYDGDASDTASTGSTGSGVVEDVFVDFFESIGRETEPTAFDGRSDYDAFVAAGIPAGGLFTGAEDIKTAEQAAKWGGTAGDAFDPCYHQACDDLDNVNLVALGEMTDALAHAVLTFAMTSSAVQGTDKGSDNATKYDPTFRGSRAIK